MSVEPATVPGLRPARIPWALVPITPALSCLTLAAGTVGLIPALTALAAAVAASTLVHVVLLIRLALSVHPRRRPLGDRGAALFGISILLAGVTVVGVVVIGPRSDSPDSRGSLLDPSAARLTVAGLLSATLLMLLGLLLVPGTVPGRLARLRRALDGLAIGACFLYSSWLVLVEPHEGSHPLAAGAALTSCAGLAIALVTGLRAVMYRPAVLACCAGAVASLVGLSGMATLFEGAGSYAWLPLAGLALVAGPAVCWVGALHAGPGPDQAEPARAAALDSGFAGYPILVVPVGAALGATGDRLISGRPFTTTAIALGLGVLLTLAVREFFTVLDIVRWGRSVATAEARYRSLVTDSADVTVVLDGDLVVRWQSPAATRHFGLSDNDVLDRPFTALVHPDDVVEVRNRLAVALTGPAGEDTAPGAPGLLAARLRDGSGRWHDTESTVSDLRAVPEVGALVVNVRDVGGRRELERTPHQLVYADHVTGLANRRALLRTIEAMRAVPGQPGSLLLIELGGLPRCDGAQGCEAGDALLVEVAHRLRAVTAPSDLLARLSATEFAVATADHPIQAYAVACRILARLNQPYPLPDGTVPPAVSIGMAELAGASSVADAVSRTGLALGRARQLRQGRIEWYDEALEADLLRRFVLEQELPGVVARGELDLTYQPILDLVDDTPVGAEVLLRWRHPALGTVQIGRAHV